MSVLDGIMGELRRLCVITRGYPWQNDMNRVFVKQLVMEFADIGIECHVIAPVSIFEQFSLGRNKRPSKYIEKTASGNVVHVYCPRYVSLSSKRVLGFKTGKLTSRFFRNAIQRVFIKLPTMPDAMYGHFVAFAGVSAAAIGEKYGIPVFIACGESNYSTFFGNSNNMARNALNLAKGIIAVSQKNKDELLDQKIVTQDQASKIEVLPNGYNPDVFHPISQKDAREKLGIPPDKFIVSFTGAFTERKGPLRLLTAISGLPNVYAIYMGKGPQQPVGERVLFAGSVHNEDIVNYLNASDVFVLPTLQEGCCNAIIEAIACGLPIISSDLPFNDELLIEDNSIRIDPNDPEAIMEALRKLIEHPELRRNMSLASIRMSEGFRLSSRAKNIKAFIEKRI